MNEEMKTSLASAEVKARKPFEAPRMEKIDIASTEAANIPHPFGTDGTTAYHSGPA